MKFQAAIAAVLSPLAFVWAQDASPCVDVHVSVEDENHYRVRDNRCEGVFELPTSLQPVVELVGFQFDEPDLDFAYESTLRLEVPRWKRAIVRIQALHVEPLKAYRMDAALAAGATAFEWNMDVVNSLRYRADQVKLTAWIVPSVGDRQKLRIGEDKLFLPVRVVKSGADAEKDGGVPKVWLRANTPMHNREIRLFDMTSPGKPIFPEMVQGKELGESCLRIELPTELEDGRVYMLQVAYLPSLDGGSVKKSRFFFCLAGKRQPVTGKAPDK